MLSYVVEFNLKVAGEEAEEYLTKVLREWPALYAELPGVQGTQLLANAFALAGEYSYQWRVDMESFKTLKIIDEALTSDNAQWKNARADWFQLRGEVRARLLRHHSGTREFCRYDTKNRDGLILYSLSYRSDCVELKAIESNKDVCALQHLASVIQPSSNVQYETWIRLVDLSSLETINRSISPCLDRLFKGTGVTSHLYGELRELDGALLAGA